MKTRRLATALESGRVEESNDQAAGLVSRTTVRREGDCSSDSDGESGGQRERPRTALRRGREPCEGEVKSRDWARGDMTGLIRPKGRGKQLDGIRLVASVCWRGLTVGRFVKVVGPIDGIHDGEETG